jgi:predicted alpha/beta-hydrolase family hydrolase
VLDQILDIDTPHGPARAHLQRVGAARGALLLGHGAGGSIDAPDILAACAAALEHGVSVARIEQPYKVAGRRAAAPAKQLDAAWIAVHAALCGADEASPFAELPVLAGGRSSGARVACRTAADTGAAGVLCLAFPLHPPGKPEKTRLPELEAVDVPVLVVQGERDPFGMPPSAPPLREVVVVPGDHAMKAGATQVGPAVGPWLDRVLA